MTTTRCSILSKSKDKKESCLTRSQIEKITKMYNVEKDDNLPLGVNKKTLVSNLKKTLNIVDEKKLSGLDFVKRDPMMHYSLKKLMYKKRLGYRKDGWLNTYDIDDVMNQYALKYNFNYTGAVPSDYYTKHHFRKSFPCYMIFNLDPMHKPGSHWVSMVVDKDKNIEYFDSNGVKPNRNIHNFIKSIGGKLKWYNKETYQREDGLCGIYAIYFLIKKAKKDCVCLNEKIADTVMKNTKKEIFI